MRTSNQPYFHTFLILIVSAAVAQADVRLPKLFSDHVVLQRGKPIVVWGWADPGEQVSVAFNNDSKQTTADARGDWRVQFPAMSAGGPYEIVVVAANEIKISDVLIGDVWLCAGQSNMVSSMQASGKEDYWRNDTLPQLRLFKVGVAPSYHSRQDAGKRWLIAHNTFMRGFSAVGYHFGREIHLARKVPVGLIQAACGSTGVQSWLSRDVLRSSARFGGEVDKWHEALQAFDDYESRFDEHYADWRNALNAFVRQRNEYTKAAAEARREGRPLPERPVYPQGPFHWKNPTVLYSGMIETISDFPIKGVLWYQGESNVWQNADGYGELLEMLVTLWRKDWRDPALPFLIVQLPQMANHRNLRFWPVVRDEQRRVAKRIDNVWMTVNIDLNPEKDLHPPNKQPFGERLAHLARAAVYGEDVVPTGPLYRSHAVEDGMVRIEFDDFGDGLVSRDDNDLVGFVVAGEDRQFKPAKAKIDGSAVLVWHDEVPSPVAVRYAWEVDPVVNLYSRAGLPAAPFRTDDWPIR